MNDFEHHLTALLDDVAQSVDPRPDVEALFAPTITPVANEVHVYRPRWFAVAAAGLVLVGGSAFAMERVTHDPPTRLVPANSPDAEPQRDATTTTSSETSLDGVVDVSLPPQSVFKPVIVVDRPSGVEPTIPTVPPTEPTVPEPTLPAAVIEFTARLGTDGRANTPMTQGFYGNADPGAAIHVSSDYGVSDTVATAEGKWKTTLTMTDVPAGTKVGVRIASSTSDRVRQFVLERPGATPTTPPVATIEFLASLGADGQSGSPMTEGFFGTAQPGSAIHVATQWGVADTTAGPEGHWEVVVTMPDVPPGTTVAVRITSNTSTRVREFTLHRPGPVTIDFTAHEGWTTTDATPPVDEFTGTSTAGALIAVTSPYGNAQVESNADGQWSSRPTFPDAPVGVTFNVHITSSKSTVAYDFPLTRVSPA
jgi:hypothetical protein